MRISSVTLSNFRSFGPEPTTVDLNDLSAFVGSNGCGKTAFLQALLRLFGTSTAERGLRRDDFHVPPGKALDEVNEISLCVECRIEFPELGAAGADATNTIALAECFRQMVVPAEGGKPFCRARLEGRWTRSNLPDGDIEEAVHWVLTDAAEVRPEHKVPMRSYDRSRIHRYRRAAHRRLPLPTPPRRSQSSVCNRLP